MIPLHEPILGAFQMKKYERILLALDLKEEDDEKVCNHCIALAEGLGAEVSLVHAVEPIMGYGYGEATSSETLEKAREQMETSAKARVAEIGEKLSVQPENQHVATGFVKKVILDTSKQVSADLIVVGTHGRHGISALFFGDTAGDMVHNSKCDVLAVPLKS